MARGAKGVSGARGAGRSGGIQNGGVRNGGVRGGSRSARSADRVLGAMKRSPPTQNRMMRSLQDAAGNPQKLQQLRDRFGMDANQLGKLGDRMGVPGCGPNGCGPKAPGSPAADSPCGPQGCEPKAGPQQRAAAQEAGDPSAAPAGAEGAAAGQEAGTSLDIHQIMEFIKNLVQGAGEQQGAADPTQQLMDQIDQAQSLEELQQILQQAGDPRQLPPEVQRAIAQKAQALGAQ